MEMGQDATRMAVLETSIRGTSRVFLVMLAGFLASTLPRNEPLLTSQSCRIVSRVYTRVFQPAFMVASIGSTMTLSTLRDSWQLAVGASFTVFMSFSVAWLFGRAFLRPQDRREFLPVQLAIAFPNAGAFPLLLMESICQQETIKIDFNGDSATCFKSATTLIFLYVMVWQLIFFSWGFYALGNDRTLEFKLSGQYPPASGEQIGAVVGESLTGTHTNDLAEAGSDLGNSAMQTNRVGIMSTNTQRDGPPPLMMTVEEGRDVAHGRHRHDMNDRQLKGNTSNSQAKAPSVQRSTKESTPLLKKQAALAEKGMEDVPAGTFNMGSAQKIRERCLLVGKWAREGNLVTRVVASPNNIAVYIAITISAISPLQKMLFDDPRAALWSLGAAVQTLGTPAVAISTVVMAASLVQIPRVVGEANQEKIWNRHRITMGALHVVCRLIVFPAGGFIAFWLASNMSSVMGSNRLMHLVLLIEFSVPSANMIIVTLNQLGMPATAGFVARLYIAQYLVSMFTMSAWTAIALRMLY